MALITKFYRLIPEHKIFLGMRIMACYAGDFTVLLKREILGHIHSRLNIYFVFSRRNPLLMAVLAKFGNIPFYDKTMVRFMTYIAIIGPYRPSMNGKNQYT